MSTRPDSQSDDTLLGDADDAIEFSGIDSAEDDGEAAAITRSSIVSLREITEETLEQILRLKVTPEQENFVASNDRSIAQAHFSKNAWFRAIYADETPVGFLMLYDDPTEGTYFLWRLMIDAQFQRMGYGRQALDLLIKHVRNRPNADSLGTSFVPGEGTPGEFYKKYGFEETGEVDDGEIVVAKSLWPA
ncbi:MAG: GNAT family N-acetyltransferase [Caldilineaceae bacterium]